MKIGTLVSYTGCANRIYINWGKCRIAHSVAACIYNINYTKHII